MKAANTRAFVPYIVALQQRAVLIRKTPKNVHMLKAVEALPACYSIVYDGSYSLGGTELGKLREHLDRFGRHYQWLAVTAMNEGKMMWHIVPKFHFVLAHLGQQAALINPRFVQGYLSESMVGVVAALIAPSGVTGLCSEMCPDLFPGVFVAFGPGHNCLVFACLGDTFQLS